jgi:hypothetical protein
MNIPATLACWWLADPAAPELVGKLSLVPGNRACEFRYEPTWKRSLSPA